MFSWLARYVIGGRSVHRMSKTEFFSSDIFIYHVPSHTWSKMEFPQQVHGHVCVTHTICIYLTGHIIIDDHHIRLPHSCSFVTCCNAFTSTIWAQEPFPARAFHAASVHDGRLPPAMSPSHSLTASIHGSTMHCAWSSMCLCGTGRILISGGFDGLEWCEHT